MASKTWDKLFWLCDFTFPICKLRIRVLLLLKQVLRSEDLKAGFIIVLDVQRIKNHMLSKIIELF